MAYLTDLFESLRTVIVDTWPEVESNGVYHASTLVRRSIEGKIEADQLPLAALEFGLQPADYGLANRVEEGPVRIYRVFAGDQDSDLEEHVAAGEALRAALWQATRDGTLLAGQVVGTPALSWSFDLPLNAYFLRGNKPFFAVCVTAQVLIGENDL